jgi:hypothetical protein
MFLNEKDKELMKDEERQKNVLNSQLGGWIIESHYWGTHDEQNMQTCKWCGMKANTFARTFDPSEFKLCPENPLIKQIQEDAYDFYS